MMSDGKMKAIRCASFFAGVGGIDLGFAQAGMPTIIANEIDKDALTTFKANHHATIIEGSIADICAQDLPDFDVLLAGFPCQAFSIAGYRKGFSDKGRGDLFFELERIFSHKKPQVIFLENVKNLLSHDGGKTFSIIVQCLQANGYHVHYQVMNACAYGNIAQNRERIYIVCFRDKKYSDRFHFPEKIPLTTTISDCLEKEEMIAQKYYYTAKTPFFAQLVDEVVNAQTLYQWRRRYVRANKSGLCPTLTANMGMGGHNVPLVNVQGKASTIRKLTPRECFNFQGFDKDFILPDLSDAKLYKQAGNSVVVPVIRRIAEQIFKVLHEKG